MNNRTITIATGRLLGGGSAVNGLVWVSLFNKMTVKAYHSNKKANT